LEVDVKLRLGGVCVCCVALASYHCQADRPRQLTDKEVRKELDTIAEQYVKDDFSYVLSWKRRIVDKGSTWEYVFEVPEHMFGGDFEITISKTTMKIMRVLIGQ
jgi:hypothetical protein